MREAAGSRRRLLLPDATRRLFDEERMIDVHFAVLAWFLQGGRASAAAGSGARAAGVPGRPAQATGTPRMPPDGPSRSARSSRLGLTAFPVCRRADALIARTSGSPVASARTHGADTSPRDGVHPMKTDAASRRDSLPRSPSKPRAFLRRTRTRPRVTTPGVPARFALLSSSLGNCYFHQIRDLIAAGLAELGHLVVVRERGGRVPRRRRLASRRCAHEFFFLGRGESLRRSRWPDNVIIVSTEQPST